MHPLVPPSDMLSLARAAQPPGSWRRQQIAGNLIPSNTIHPDIINKSIEPK